MDRRTLLLGLFGLAAGGALAATAGSADAMPLAGATHDATPSRDAVKPTTAPYEPGKDSAKVEEARWVRRRVVVVRRRRPVRVVRRRVYTRRVYRRPVRRVYRRARFF